MKYPKRLIEVDLPIARISAHSRREKSIRHGHISTLHIWWARRPLAACRAVICASLWPDPADELCPQAFREAAVEQITAFAKRFFPDRTTDESRLLLKIIEKSLGRGEVTSLDRWEAIAKGKLVLDANDPENLPTLRARLLDFIADFANWDNSTVPAYLEASRALTQAAHEALGGAPGTRPLMVDPFAGGGSIPLEALRVGADAFASDLNPVAVLLNKVVLEYIPKFGHRLADEVRKWGQWIKEQAEQELAEFYPSDPNGATPIAYLWARTILSEAPGQGDVPVEIPMMTTMWLAKASSHDRALRWVRDEAGGVVTDTCDVPYADGQTRRVRRPRLEMFVPQSSSQVEKGTVARGSATCPVTGFTTPMASVRKQMKTRRGGARDARLLAVRYTSLRTKVRSYRSPSSEDIEAADAAAVKLSSLTNSNLPIEPTPKGGGRGAGRAFSQRNYGMDQFTDLFTPRQLLALSTIVRLIHDGTGLSRCDDGDIEFASAVKSCLALVLGRLTDFSSSLCTLNTTGNRGVKNTFVRQAIPIVWDFMETNPLNEVGANWDGGIVTMEATIRLHSMLEVPGDVRRASAMSHLLPGDSVAGFVTDLPYYDAVPYSDLSDYFYVWLKRVLPNEPLLQDALTPKDDECIVDDAKGKNDAYFEKNMALAMSEGRRVLIPSGIGVVVFANKTTQGWEALLKAMVDAGWIITGSWPIDTERAGRLRAMNSAALGSSVHLVCRPREDENGNLIEEVGEWRDVLSELPKRIHEWMPRLAAEGVVGADAIFACLGPALEIFSRYSRVEKASGEAVPLREYLEQVWATVSTEALSMIFKDADAAGLEPDARLTAMWLWTLGADEDKSNGNGVDDKVTASTGYTLEYDAARKIAQGLGIHLEQSESIVEVKGDKARLLSCSERTRHLFGKEEASATSARGRKKTKEQQRSLFEELDELEAEAETAAGELKPQAGETVLDRVHQSMILFAAGRGEALRRFLVEDGAGTDARFWKLAQSLSALYPRDTDEKRWVDGVLARKKGLGL